VIDLEHAHLTPRLRVASTFVHQGQARDVEAVMVDGRWLMRDGKVLTIDEERIVADAQAIAERAWSRLFESRPDLRPPPGFELKPPGAMSSGLGAPR
jgi:5-methylthioadenosine/S-adenosylhomocysteine deaminase